jgi:hypothetical protein
VLQTGLIFRFPLDWVCGPPPIPGGGFGLSLSAAATQAAFASMSASADPADTDTVSDIDSESAGVMPQTVRGRHGSCFVGEPDQLGFERENPLSALGGRLVELAEPHRDAPPTMTRRQPVSMTTTCMPSA